LQQLSYLPLINKYIVIDYKEFVKAFQERNVRGSTYIRVIGTFPGKEHQKLEIDYSARDPSGKRAVRMWHAYSSTMRARERGSKLNDKDQSLQTLFFRQR
jgi:hypothetical protein